MDGGGVEMKNGKRPNVRQAKLLQSVGLDHKAWLISKDTPKEVEIVHRESGEVKIVKW